MDFFTIGKYAEVLLCSSCPCCLFSGNTRKHWLTVLTSVPKAIECQECVDGMGMFPDALLAWADVLNETLYNKYCHQPGWFLSCKLLTWMMDILPNQLTLASLTISSMTGFHLSSMSLFTCLGSPPSRFPPRGCLCRWWPMQRWCCWQLPRHDEAHSPELHCRHCHWAALYELLCSYNCCPLNWIFWIYQIFHVILSMSFTCQLIINTLVTHFG